MLGHIEHKKDPAAPDLFCVLLSSVLARNYTPAILELFRINFCQQVVGKYVHLHLF